MNPHIASPQVRTSGQLALACTLLLLALFTLVGYLSPGFDDEFVNTDLIANHGIWGTAHKVQGEDVHPPGAYVLNGVLFEALGSWQGVRAFSGLLYVAALFYFHLWVRRRHGNAAGWWVLILGGLNPAALMWCTSLRWYAYFVPLMYWTLACPDDTRSAWFRIKPVLGLLLMAHIGYAALILAPVVVVHYALHDDRPPLAHARHMLPAWLLGLLAFVPQGWVFFTVHMPAGEGQAGSLFKSLVGLAIGSISNQGVFPISAGGVLAFAGWALMGWAVIRQPRVVAHNGLWGYLLANGLLVLTGLAGKFRNLVLVAPFEAAAAAVFSRLWLSGRVAQVGLGLLIASRCVGLYNVALHEGTTKNSWNTPVPEVVAALQQATAGCNTPPAVYTTDTQLAHILAEPNHRYRVFSYYQRPVHPVPTQPECLVVAKTFKGSMPKAHHDALVNALAGLKAASHSEVPLGHDGLARIKRKIDPDFPDHAVVLYTFRQPQDLSALNRWLLSGDVHK